MYRRRRYYYGKARKTVRRYKRRYPIRKTVKPKSKYDQTHLVKRFGSIMSGTVVPAVVQSISNPATDQTYRFYFRLDAVSGYQDFTALYDLYKIRAVKVSFIPMVNVTMATESGYASLIYSTYDFNGESSNPTKDQIREYQYCKWSPYGKIHKRYFFPRTTEWIYGSSTVSGSSTKVGPQNWISTASPDIPYHGLIVNVSNVPSIPENEPIFKIEVKYYLSFKNTK